MALNRQSAIAAAEKLVSRGKIEAAIKEYRKLLAENPNDASTLNRLGDLYVRLNQIDEATRLFAQIADRYTEDGFFVKAIAIFKKIIKLDPTRLAVYERLAELYHRQGLVTEARTQYQVLVDYYQKHSNTTAAISVLQRMVTLEPEDPSPHVKLAEIFHSLQQSDKELLEYRTIAELMVRRQRIDEATQVYMKAVAAAPHDLAFITDAVLGLKDAGHTAAAARLLTLAVERNPQAEKIARLMGGLGRRERAMPAEIEPRVMTVNELIAEPPAIEPPGERTGARPIPPVPPPPPSAPPALSFDESLVEGELPPMPRVRAPQVEPLDEEFVLELPEEGEPPSTIVQPTPDMLRHGPESAWREPEAPLVEFELEIEGVESRPVERPPSAQPPSSLPASPPRAAEVPTSGSAEAKPFQIGLPAAADEDFEIEWEFEPEPELRLDLPEPVQPTPATTPAAATRPLDLEELEKTSFEVAARSAPAARRAEDLLAEAEVFAKYGLREKAHDRAREILQTQPRNIGALALQLTLWLEEGKHERVVQRAKALAQLAVGADEADSWAQLRQKLIKAGYRVEGDQVVAAPVPKRPQKDSVSLLLEDLVGLGGPKPAKPKPKRETKLSPASEALAALEAEVTRPTPSRPPAAARPSVPSPAAWPTPGAPAPPPRVAPAAALAPPPPASGVAEPPVPPSTADTLLDAEELPGISIPQLPRDSQVVAPPRLADESLAWLDKLPTPHGGVPTPDEALFEDEEGFFDLAAELEQELSKEELLTGKGLIPPQEQSLEEIVEGFKKGVAESLSPEDYDTHFNLGIAYREMGLVDEAIGEFQLAAKNAKYLLDCCSLLGACFLEKGLPELAVKWYQRGLETPELTEDAMLGLLYDLGNLYATTGEAEKARKTFVEIYGINSNYRDVVARLEELGA